MSTAADTFDDLPPSASNPLWVSELMFSGLRNFVGPVITGLASPIFASDCDWGRAIQLSADESLQVRIFPRGVISSGRLAEVSNLTIMVAARRTQAGIGKDTVSLAILWNPAFPGQELQGPAFDFLNATAQPVAARNLHIALPSLFNHHDAKFGSAPDDAKPKSEWPILDDSNFHAVRPGSFSVHRANKLSDDQRGYSICAAPGVSQFVIAGNIGGVDIDDPSRMATEPINHKSWDQLIKRYEAQLTASIGDHAGFRAMHNATIVADMLTAEGMLGILGHGFSRGAMPDMLHSPGGFPLLIAFAARVACYPSRFNLVGGTDADVNANNELTALFEGNWKPISDEKAGGKNLFAIDLAMKRAWTEARQHARRFDITKAVDDNVTFWHRVGQRCVTTVFGASLEDFVPPKTQFGVPERLVDPLAEARNHVVQQRLSAAKVVVDGGGRPGPSPLATNQEKRSVLLTVMNSVEHWLRTGSYGNMQIHAKNSVNMRIHRGNGEKRLMNRTELLDALELGMQDSVSQAVASGQSEESAWAAARLLHTGIADHVAKSGEDTIDFNNMGLSFSAEVAAALGLSVEQPACAEDSVDQADACIEAFKSAVNALSAALCQGAMLHHQFSLSVFLNNASAVLPCADCDAEVHLLNAVFFSSHKSECERCHRPRCITCTSKAHSRGHPTSLDGRSHVQHCKRCKPEASPPAAKGSRKKKSG